MFKTNLPLLFPPPSMVEGMFAALVAVMAGSFWVMAGRAGVEAGEVAKVSGKGRGVDALLIS